MVYLQLPAVLLVADNLGDPLAELVLRGLQTLLHQHQLLFMVRQLCTQHRQTHAGHTYISIHKPVYSICACTQTHIYTHIYTYLFIF